MTRRAGVLLLMVAFLAAGAQTALLASPRILCVGSEGHLVIESPTRPCERGFVSLSDSEVEVAPIQLSGSCTDYQLEIGTSPAPARSEGRLLVEPFPVLASIFEIPAPASNRSPVAEAAQSLLTSKLASPVPLRC